MRRGIWRESLAIGIPLGERCRIPGQSLWRSRCLSPTSRRSCCCCCHSSPSEHFLFVALLLFELSSTRCGLLQRVYHLTGNFWRKYRSGVQRVWDRHLPCLEHFIQFSPRRFIHRAVSIHKCRIEPVRQKQSIRATNILGYRVQYIERWQFVIRFCLTLLLSESVVWV